MQIGLCSLAIYLIWASGVFIKFIRHSILITADIRKYNFVIKKTYEFLISIIISEIKKSNQFTTSCSRLAFI